MSYIEFIAGCNAGLFGVLVGHPMVGIFAIKWQVSYLLFEFNLN